jgi:peptidoglycan hydrolase-like protein with peptidoglycan-binding domain
VHNRDLADPRHARTSLRTSIDRRLRRARRERTTRGGRRALWVAALMLCVATSGAFALTREQTIAVQEKVGVTADGVIGPQTKSAIKRFQRRNGLTVDGVVGPETLQAMGIAATPKARAAKKARTITEEPPSTDEGRLEAIAQCESGGDPTAVSAGGQYRGKYQFSRATWKALGGEGDPADAPEAEQDRMAAKLLATQGPAAWPNCA